MSVSLKRVLCTACGKNPAQWNGSIEEDPLCFPCVQRSCWEAADETFRNETTRVCEVTMGRHRWATVESLWSSNGVVNHIKYTACRECGERP